MNRWYVFYNKDAELMMCPVREHETPEEVGALLGALAAVGPFQTKRGALYFEQFGRANPHCRCVDEAERHAKRTIASAYDWAN